jgi:hypothetical protein
MISTGARQQGKAAARLKQQAQGLRWLGDCLGGAIQPPVNFRYGLAVGNDPALCTHRQLPSATLDAAGTGKV